MNYKKEYKKLKADIENAYLFAQTDSTKAVLEYILPELAESDDEKIRKTLIDYFDEANKVDENQFELFGIHTDKVLAWLEKQGESKPTDIVEPKFHKGDWVVREYTKDIITINQVVDVKRIDDECFGYTLDDGTYFSGSWESSYHLWTIKDAKDGDVLAFDNDNIVIFKDLYNYTSFHSYCHIEDGIFDFSTDELPDWWEDEGFKPATKEQRDLLFQKMKEEGYEWNADKKELKKIEPKPSIEMITPEESLCISPEEYNEIVNGCLYGDLKSAWSEEDIFKVQRICKYLDEAKKYYADITEVRECINWLKSLEERLKGE